MLKARVTWIRPGRWEVYESEAGKTKMQHHSFHRTEAAARSAANAQNRINRREAAEQKAHQRIFRDARMGRLQSL